MEEAPHVRQDYGPQDQQLTKQDQANALYSGRLLAGAEAIEEEVVRRVLEGGSMCTLLFNLMAPWKWFEAKLRQDIVQYVPFGIFTTHDLISHEDQDIRQYCIELIMRRPMLDSDEELLRRLRAISDLLTAEMLGFELKAAEKFEDFETCDNILRQITALKRGDRELV